MIELAPAGRWSWSRPRAAARRPWAGFRRRRSRPRAGRANCRIRPVRQRGRSLEGDVLDHAVTVDDERNVGGRRDQGRRSLGIEIAQRFLWGLEHLHESLKPPVRTTSPLRLSSPIILFLFVAHLRSGLPIRPSQLLGFDRSLSCVGCRQIGADQQDEFGMFDENLTADHDSNGSVRRIRVGSCECRSPSASSFLSPLTRNSTTSNHWLRMTSREFAARRIGLDPGFPSVAAEEFRQHHQPEHHVAEVVLLARRRHQQRAQPGLCCSLSPAECDAELAQHLLQPPQRQRDLGEVAEVVAPEMAQVRAVGASSSR